MSKITDIVDDIIVKTNANTSGLNIHNAVSKPTPADNDELALLDSDDVTTPFSLKKLTWANLKNVLFGSPAFTGIPTAPTATAGTNTTQIATTAFVANLDSANVKLTGNQTIDGVKTFSSSPIVPTPTANTQVANKAYVDSKSSTGYEYSKSLADNGYMSFTNGLILQWGSFTTESPGVTQRNFPIAFPNQCVSMGYVFGHASDPNATPGTVGMIRPYNRSSFHSYWYGGNASWKIWYIAIGY